MNMNTKHTAPALAASPSLTGAEFCTYRVGGPLDCAYQPTTLDEAVDVLRFARENQQNSRQPLTVLGWGGNSIIASRGIRGITLITRKMTWVRPVDNQPHTFEFGAGVHLAKVSAEALQHSLSGGEFMIGIPGTVGGAIRMNAGALQQEMSDVVVSAQVFNLENGQLETWDKKRLSFAYRHSAIDPEKHIVLSATLRFQPGSALDIKSKMDASVQFRKAHHPTEPNGGSVFANPSPEEPAGKLLDQLGARNPVWQEGGVHISPLHCNFIVNTSHGTSTDILKLMLRMKFAIFEHYHLDVYPENKFIGDATDEETKLWRQLQEPLA